MAPPCTNQKPTLAACRRFVAIAAASLIAWSTAATLVGCRAPAGASSAAVGSATGGSATTQATSDVDRQKHDWKIAPGIPLKLDEIDKSSPEFARFRRWVELAVDGHPDYGFSASDAALLERMVGGMRYCELAVRMVDQDVAAAETAIDAGNAPAIAADSYLDVGPRIADLALTLDSCKHQIDPKERERWSAYAEQTIWNVWHPYLAHWGHHPHPWSGWSTDNPGNNYYYSFVEATLYWALASGSEDWMRTLGEEKMPALQAYFAKLPGGGSLEGTGYGASHMRLFSIYRLWRDATGEDIANANSHANDSIAYWVHATVPTLDRFAPIGDQSRSSVPELYDYHRRLMLEALALSRDPKSRALASWWLHHISVQRMGSGFNSRYDLLSAGDAHAPAPVAPSEGVIYHFAEGAGHLFARTSWDRDAVWLAFVAGPYNESHAHQEQGGFTLFAGDWLTVSNNIWTHSGIQQGSELHNVLRFEQDNPGAPYGRPCRSLDGPLPESRKSVPQCVPSRSRMTVAPRKEGLHLEADLSGAYGDDSPVKAWTRTLDFAGQHLRVQDRYSAAPGIHAVFQLQLPVEPVIGAGTNSTGGGPQAQAGALKIRVIEPADARLQIVELGHFAPEELRKGWRLDISGGSGRYLVDLEVVKK